MKEQEFWEKLGMDLPDSEEVGGKFNTFKSVADSMYNMYATFIQSGFSEEQAWAFVFHQWVIGLQMGHRDYSPRLKPGASTTSSR